MDDKDNRESYEGSGRWMFVFPDAVYQFGEQVRNQSYLLHFQVQHSNLHPFACIMYS